MSRIAVSIPIKTVSVLNLREHWSKRASRAKLHRVSTFAELRTASGVVPISELLGPVVVEMVRVAPRMLDDDNLRGALKAVRDGVADWLGVLDNDPRIRWDYGQRKGKPKTYSVDIEVRAA